MGTGPSSSCAPGCASGESPPAVRAFRLSASSVGPISILGADKQAYYPLRSTLSLLPATVASDLAWQGCKAEDRFLKLVRGAGNKTDMIARLRALEASEAAAMSTAETPAPWEQEKPPAEAKAEPVEDSPTVEVPPRILLLETRLMIPRSCIGLLASSTASGLNGSEGRRPWCYNEGCVCVSQDEDSPPVTEADLSKLTVGELQNLLKAKNILIGQRKRKAQLIQMLLVKPSCGLCKSKSVLCNLG